MLPSLVFQKIDGEDTSQNTNQNIDELFRTTDYLKYGNQHLVIVSSTFHLIRIGKKILRCKEEGDHHPINTIIDKVLLIGAENSANVESMRMSDLEHIKLMMFDLYNHHLER